MDIYIKNSKFMTNATTAAATATAVRTGYTYVDSLVTGASAQGARSIIVDEKYMDDSMVSGLTITYGYNVTTQREAMGSYKRYLISW